MNRVDAHALQPLLARHLALYRSKVPYYQATMLNSLIDVWCGPHARLIDIGAGTGAVAQAIQELFPVAQVEAIDVVDRFCPNLSIPVGRFDGFRLPHGDASFDAGMLNNVVHHVPVAARIALFRDIRRVVRGPLYIKDHESRGFIDTLRLTALDAIGNIPFGGMVRARYLSRADWEELGDSAGYRISAFGEGTYRTGIFAALFPNRLETTMRFDPVR